MANAFSWASFFNTTLGQAVPPNVFLSVMTTLVDCALNWKFLFQ